ncbi:zinc-binding alcohol dehydrogenase family protein [Bradyrhizobium tropiciagri]|uniref:quinone oxidoreductase family protein n=1 Tax=Bradyrhizobium tropiciagri TaxID=312253 RepID=UPI001BAD9A10|nr:zinc-binding alcohol dehydrogenase family protein [Bradyrhizobium tropiciagri]MBR0869440.1 zinc-binding alcohol dehydrogenase family protein [Bradyrhizobium tropiciagri]
MTLTLSDAGSAPMIVEADCVRINAKAPNVNAVRLARETRTIRRGQGEVLVRIEAAGVNPSDVKATTGLMPYAVFPRTPGRDFAGTVIDGPASWLGQAVFGSSGDLGIRRDGSHASHLAVEADALVRKPGGMSMEEAAGIGVPFVTAIEGFRRTGMPKQGEFVLVFGANGKVGQAAVQIATSRGANVIGVVRKDEPYQGHANTAIEVINSAAVEVPKAVLGLTGGRGVDIVFNTVGDPYFQDANRSLAKDGRQILIAAVNRIVEFDILAFYRARHTYVGVDTLGFSSIESANVLRSMMHGFDDGSLRPFPIVPTSIYSLGDAEAAYAAVIGSSRDRIILRPGS